MEPLTQQAAIALAVAVAIFLGLQRKRGAPSDLLFLGGLVAVTLLGVITPTQALLGFANPAVLTVGALFIVATGLRNTGVLDWLGQVVLGTARTEKAALRRLAVTIVPFSAFMPNTPLVAMTVPVVLDWCRRHGVSPSRLMIPVSYLTILGGVCTLIGTSTTLLVNGMLQAQGDPDGPLRPMSLFEVGKVGLPCALIGVGYLLLLGHRRLPQRKELIEQLGDDRREYLVEMLVQPVCRLIGKTVETAGLRHLPGLFLIEIDRNDEIITPVSPSDVIRAGDRLIFTGVVTTIIDLDKIPGLVPAVDRTYDVNPDTSRHRHLSEAVLSRTSPLIGRTIREANFRRRYGAAVVAVHRNGVRLTNKVGAIKLEPGDTLLLQTMTDFEETFRHSRDFYLISSVKGSTPVRHDRAWLSIMLVVILIVWLSATSWMSPESYYGFASPAIAAIAIAGLMVLTRCLNMSAARGALDLQVLVTIAAALGMGSALQVSGAADWLAGIMTSAVTDPWMLLIALYVLAMILTEMVTNNAVAAMLFPLAIALASTGGFNPRPFIMAVLIASSVSFVTPVGYQTNLMVMGPGGYRPADYFRVGWPLALMVATTAMLLIPQMWSF